MSQGANPFFKKHFITVKGLSREDLEYLFAQANWMKTVVQMQNSTDQHTSQRIECYHPLRGKLVGVLFFQPSTRTSLSFTAAAVRLGAFTIKDSLMEFSSVAKGESFLDTIRAGFLTTQASLLVIRHEDNLSSKLATEHIDCPVINGGSGTGEHPTQALLDLYTIKDKKRRIDNLNVALVGDLRFGRTVKSLALLLATAGQNNAFRFVSAPELAFPKEFLDELPAGTQYESLSSLHEVLEWADVIYMTRTQREYFEKNGILEKYEQLRAALVLTPDMAHQMRDDAIIMHPLPRLDELPTGVDADPHAMYFEQMSSGLYIRMALMESILVQNPLSQEEVIGDTLT